jgi:hypothetical protein
MGRDVLPYLHTYSDHLSNQDHLNHICMNSIPYKRDQQDLANICRMNSRSTILVDQFCCLNKENYLISYILANSIHMFLTMYCKRFHCSLQRRSFGTQMVHLVLHCKMVATMTKVAMEEQCLECLQQR